MKDGYKIRILSQIIIKFYIPSNLQQLLSFKSSPKLVTKHALLIIFGGCGFSATEVLFIFWAFFNRGCERDLANVSPRRLKSASVARYRSVIASEIPARSYLRVFK